MKLKAERLNAAIGKVFLIWLLCWGAAPAMAQGSFPYICNGTDRIGTTTMMANDYGGCAALLDQEIASKYSDPWWGTVVPIVPATCTVPEINTKWQTRCSMSLQTAQGIEYLSSVGSPYLIADRYHDKNSCFKLGHPIYPLTGSKGLMEELGQWSIAGQHVVAAYDTKRKAPSNNSLVVFAATPAASFGELWGTNLHKRLFFETDIFGISRAIQVSRGSGVWISFTGNGISYAADGDIADRVGTAWNSQPACRTKCFRACR